MEEQMRKSQQAFAAIFRNWWDQWLQEMLGDEVMRQYWSAMGTGNKRNPPAGADPYRILGLQRSDPDDQVKKRYREMVVKLHPDTAGVKGTEFLLQLVLAAYQQISRERGWQK